MQTPTHVLIAAAAFARPGAATINAAALAGGFVPDAFLFAVWGWSKLAGVSETDLWSRVYWSDGVQFGQAVSNSFPLFAGLLVAALVLQKRAAAVFAGAGLLHLVCDFLLHAKDAHQHFWPLSTWRFESPVSYWDPAHYGAYVSLIEAAVGITLIVVLFRRFKRASIRATLVIAGLSYLAVPAYFVSTLNG
ncbi:MAG: hypothetical protein U5J99_04180 [Parvularculaceae bacterium]|nr:hypothetical protein [Parvularculaceae bacterium]